MKILISAILLFSINAFSAEETSSVKTSETKLDIDAEIKDSKLRADSGSKSKYSGSISLNYVGGSLKKPFSNSRPVVGDSVGGKEEDFASMSGNIAVRYRFNKNESLSVSTGISKIKPFDNDSENEWEASNPAFVYGNWFRYKENQMFVNLMTYIYTKEEYRDSHFVGTLATAVGGIRRIGKSKFEVGLTGYASYTYFDNDLIINKKIDTGGPAGVITVNEDLRFTQKENILSLTPRFQYRYSRGFNVYTSIDLLSYTHSRADEAFNFVKADITQQIGAGIAIYRDLYLQPNIGFYTEDIRADTTTVNLSLVANVL